MDVKDKFKKALSLVLTALMTISFIIFIPQEAVANQEQYRMPMNDYTVTGPFRGDWRVLGYSGFHTGEDHSSSDHRVFAVTSGQIVSVRNGGTNGNIGWTVVVNHGDFWAEYTHILPNENIRNASGASHNGVGFGVLNNPIYVSAGQQIGVLTTVQNTPSFIMSPHLHFAIRYPLSSWNTSRSWWHNHAGDWATWHWDMVESEGFVNPTEFIAARQISSQQPPQPEPAQMRLGVTDASHDNVGQVLSTIPAIESFDILSSQHLADINALLQYHAIFINCGTHDNVSPQILRQYVEQGGIVYASDLAAQQLGIAFPGMFASSTNTSAMTVLGADIVHTSLATHMGINQMDIRFNLGGWRAITSLDPSATVYIQGHISNFGAIPLAFSFDYGAGHVFFTSFHNHMQATGDMANFIEYLVLRIHHIEAERNLANIADQAGYVFDGFVFGTLASMQTSQPFFYTPSENDFMLLFDPAMGDFEIELTDPVGRRFRNNTEGILTDIAMLPEDMHLAFEGFPAELITTEMVVESLGSRGFRVLNPTQGEWSFTVTSRNTENDKMFAVGLAQRPTQALTRAMFVRVLANLDGVNLARFLNSTQIFEDVDASMWFYEAVQWAAEYDVTEGMGDGTFAPNAPLTREQMATMLHRYADFRGVSLPRTYDHAIDGNWEEISYWALGAVTDLLSAGIVTRVPNTANFQPQVTATSQDIAYAFERLLPLLEQMGEEEQSEPNYEDNPENYENDSQDDDEYNGSTFGLSWLMIALIGVGVLATTAGVATYLMLKKRDNDVDAPNTTDVKPTIESTNEVATESAHELNFEAEATDTCKQCSSPIKPDAKFCVKCGSPAT